MTTRSRAVAIASVFACLLAGLACSSPPPPALNRVDVRAENQPPIATSVTPAGITIAEGIGVAITIQPYVDDKQVADAVEVANTSSCTLLPGHLVNEYFLIGGAPGSGALTIRDANHGTGGVVQIPVTVVAQTK